MSATMGYLGYCGVIIPELNYFQGFFITEGHRASGEKALKVAMSIHDEKAKIISPSMEVAPEQNEALGALCAFMIEGARVSREEIIGAASYAIRELTKADYFIVRGYLEKSGTRTKFDVLASTSIYGAREALQTQPEVLLIKMRNAEEGAALAKQRDEPGLH